jgi:large subunit ribosomal protein L10
MRPEKAGVVSELQERLDESQFCLLVDYTGMHVPHFEEARKRLRDTGATLRVIKITHLQKAAAKLGFEDQLDEHLGGQCAIVFGGDVAATTKVLKNFVKEFDKPTLRAGLVEGQMMPGSDVEKLADLPSREELQAQLLGALVAPLQKLAGTLNEPPTMLARQLNEVPTMMLRVLQAKADKDKG